MGQKTMVTRSPQGQMQKVCGWGANEDTRDGGASAKGTSRVERRIRRGDRGAQGAERVMVWATLGRGSFSPLGERSGEGLCPIPRKYQFLSSKTRALVHSGTDKTHF